MSSISTVAQLERLIRSSGYVEVRRNGGSHHQYRHQATGAKLTVAFRKGQRMKPGTIKQIEQQIAAGIALQHATFPPIPRQAAAAAIPPRQARKEPARTATKRRTHTAYEDLTISHRQRPPHSPPRGAHAA